MPGPRTITVPPLLHVAPDALNGLPALLDAHFDLARVVIVTGHDTSRAYGSDLADSLRQAGSRVVLEHGPDGTLVGAERSTAALADGDPTLVVGFGGGRPIDVAKMIAFGTTTDFVAVPTVLSHDGMCSPVASLVGTDGVRQSLGTVMPGGVVIDTSVIGRAPARFLRAGIGDLVSNITAVEDWRLAAAAAGAEGPVNEFAASIALLSSRAAFDISWPPSEDDLEVIARALVMSGLAMAMAGSSRPCSGGEHLISHALDELLGPRAAIHGEQVAVGVLVTSHLHDSDAADHVAPLFERIGFPSDLEGWGLDPATLVDAIRRAPGTRPDRYTVLDEADLSLTAVEELVKSLFDTPAP